MTGVIHIEVLPKDGNATEWFEAAELELSVKQARLEDEFGAGRWKNWKADLAAGRLVLLDDAGPRVACSVQVAGSTGPNNWMWAWANASLPEAITIASTHVLAFGEEHKVDDLTERHVAADDLETLGWRLAAAAAKVSDAEGVYRAPTRTGAVYLLMFDVEAVGES